MKIKQIPVGEMANFTYIISDDHTFESVIVDPSWDLEKIFSFLKDNQLTAKYIINTHTHFDHILGNEQTSAVTGAKIIQHKNSEQRKDLIVTDRDVINLGNTQIKILHTPGHSEDSICLVINNEAILTGDTLFVNNCGRTDLPGSNVVEMYNSLYDVIKNLDESLVVYPGHNYGNTPISTIDNEKRKNPVLNFKSKNSFLKYMGNDEV